MLGYFVYFSTDTFAMITKSSTLKNKNNPNNDKCDALLSWLFNSTNRYVTKD